MSSFARILAFLALSIFSAAVNGAVAGELHEIRIDWATYNPLSLVLKDQALLEKRFAEDGVAVRWVQSRGSNKALEFLNAGSIDVGSTAGSAALLARINGNPIKSVYVYSAPEWTALVTRKDTNISQIADLKGKRVAVTRGTDPEVFLIRALAKVGLKEQDVQLVLLQHADGRAALDRGDVDAWAGLDPIMAAAEIEKGDVLFYRDRAANSYGILNVREEFAKANPSAVRKVIAAYEEARQWALKHPAEFKALVGKATGLSPEVVARQIDTRTDLSDGHIGPAQRQAILEAGLALQKVGVIAPGVDVPGALVSLIDPAYHAAAR